MEALKDIITKGSLIIDREPEGISVPEERKRKEEERWGTPEKAYETWKYRTGAFVEEAEEYVQKSVQKSEKDSKILIEKNRGKHFFYQSKHKIIGLGYEQKPVDIISLKGFSYKPMEPNSCYYQITMNGRQVFLNKLIDTPQGKVIIEDIEGLEGLLRQILVPQIIAHKFKEDCDKEMENFYELGEKLRQTPSSKYFFECIYNGGAYLNDRLIFTLPNNKEEAEDVGTEILFGDKKIRVPNPFFIESFIENAGQGIKLMTRHTDSPITPDYR